MAGNTTIEWTRNDDGTAGKTWNFLRGCQRVSTGCGTSTEGGCYAERIAYRFSGPGQPYEGLAHMTADGPRWSGDIRIVDELIELPLRWKKPCKIFVNSMSDLFYKKVPFDVINRFCAVVYACPQHVFQVLTKRAETMLQYFGDPQNAAEVVREYRTRGYSVPNYSASWPPPNLWLGISCENQATADHRIPLLLKTPASIRWISAEPLLEEIRIQRYFQSFDLARSFTGDGCEAYQKVHWVIAGAESGPRARPMDERWVRSLRDQCLAADVKFFYKQNSTPTGKKIPLPMLDGRRWKEFPDQEK